MWGLSVTTSAVKRLITSVIVLLTASPVLARQPKGEFTMFTARTRIAPEAQIAGWFLPATQPRGTLICAHGYGAGPFLPGSAGKDQMLGIEWIRDRLQWNVVLFDFRGYGQSS